MEVEFLLFLLNPVNIASACIQGDLFRSSCATETKTSNTFD